MKKLLINVLFFLLFTVVLVLFINIKESRSQEVIKKFKVELKIDTDGSLLVKEFITVNSELNKIKHGIYRSIPTITWKNKVLHQYEITLLQTTLDNKPVHCRTKESDLLTTFILGDPAQNLTPGTHVFSLVYRTKGHIVQDGDHYELNYNVTGSLWDFQILEASLELATIHPEINLTETLAYVTHNQKFKGECQTLASNSFQTKRPLEAREAMVVRANINASNLSLPSPTFREKLSQHSTLILSLVFGLPLLIFGFWAWRLGLKVEPKVKDLDSIPEGLTPSLCACVAEHSENAGLADLLWLMVRGFLRLHKTASSVYFIPTKPAHALNHWSDAACLRLMDELFSTPLKQNSDSKVTPKLKDWKALEDQNLNTLFKNLKI
ncbi:MAG: DUF2207 domain-containing protein, partial [Desulfovibrionaceae bacterium]|nr:DUF2207 domain-containing protein [Desulfovibrionaceae bacterium]